MRFGNVDVRPTGREYNRLPSLAGEVSEHGIGGFRADHAVSSSRDARRTPARLPNATSSAFRRRGPMPGTLSSSDRRSRIDRALRWNVTANRCASSRICCTSRSAGSSFSNDDRLFAIARVDELFLLGDADRDEIREPELRAARRRPPTAAPCRRRSG